VPALAALALGICPAAATAHGLQTGFADGVYGSANAHQRNHWLSKTRAAHSRVVRMNVSWAGTAPHRPAHPRDPSDPAYNFAGLDAAVRSAASHHLRVLLTVLSAPRWAEAGHRPHNAPPGTWKPSPGAFGDFGHALGARYSGHFGGVPRVRYFQAWNEPNLSQYLTPQYKGKKQKSAARFRKMLNAFYAGVHSAQPSDRVLNGGLAPYGDPPGGSRTRPLTFMRRLLCLRNGLGPAKHCHGKTHVDVFADHPIDTSGGPHRSAVSRNDAATPDFKHVTATLRAAERHHLVKPGGHRPLWATELWWDSDPPDHVQGVPVKVQAHWLEEALHILWNQGASVVINLQIRDAKFDRHNAFANDSTGVFFHSGKPKPSFTAWRFPFVVSKRTHSAARVWGRSPAGGRLRIQAKRHGRWHTVKSIHVHSGQIFRPKVHVRPGRTLRAHVGAAKSLGAN
jgi:hypothetical protein